MSPSRSPSPYRKLQRASANIDEITKALAQFSRSATPEPSEALRCSCCQNETCETTESWARDRTKLESKLVLSAEIGQALLERHEAYAADHSRLYSVAQEKIIMLERSNEQALSRLTEVIKSKDNTDKRLTQSRLNLEVAESSNRALLREVQESRAVITRLSANVARSAGWEERLAGLIQERDDLVQERDAELSRSRSLEMKLNAASAKCASLQAEVNRLADDAVNQHSQQQELSDEILQDARARLEMLHNTLGQPIPAENSEFTRVAEALVAENEGLKRDNAELQNLLTDARSELRTLSEELQEHRARFSPTHPIDVVLKSGSPASISPLNRRGALPLNLNHIVRRPGETWSASFGSSLPNSPPPYQLGFSRNSSPKLLSLPLGGPEFDGSRIRRDDSPGADLTRQRFRRSPSPTTSVATSNTKHTTSENLPTANSTSHNSEGVEDVMFDAQTDSIDVVSAAKAKKRTLMLLSRSRGVQTDPERGRPRTLVPSPRSLTNARTSSFEGDKDTSDTSSLPDRDVSAHSATSPLPELIDRLTALLMRVNQADVETLTARLKRQHLTGGDVRHLSRTTINSIMNDVTALRNHFKASLETERHEMTRKDLRNLLKFAKDIFSELGKLRSTVNDVTLDPSSASKLGRDDPQSSGPSNGWIAPISRFFTPASDIAQSSQTIGRTNEFAGPSKITPFSPKRHPIARPAPKLAAAVSSSTTTVKVEFASSRSGRAVSSTVEPNMGYSPGAVPGNNLSNTQSQSSIAVRGKPRREHLLGIFAGAPQSVSTGDSWVVVPDKSKHTRRVRNMQSEANFGDGNATLRTSQSTRHRLSRNVDAIIDSMSRRDGVLGEEPKTSDDWEGNEDESDFQETILERTRTLRPRGLSDSSIHSTFLTTPVNRLLTPAGLALSSHDASSATGDAHLGAYDRQSVLRMLSQKVQSFATGYSTTGTSLSGPTVASDIESSTPASSPPRVFPRQIRQRTLLSPGGAGEETASSSLSSPGRMPAISSLMPNLASWSASEEPGDVPRGPTRPGVSRDDDVFDRPWGRGRDRL